MTNKELSALLERHSAFWSRAAVDRPLYAVLPERVWKGKPYPVRGGRELHDPTPISPDDIDIRRLLGLDRPLPEITTADLINSVGCVYPQAWMEAIIGCPIVASAFGCVGRAVASSAPEALASFCLEEAARSAWLPVIDRLIATACDAAGGSLAVQQLHLRGVVDMLAAYLGEEALCLAVHDAPAELEALAGLFAEVHIQAAKRVQGRPPWRAGYVSSWRLYAPGPLLDYQIDATNLISPSVYARHFLKADRRVISQFSHVLLHMHACGLHQLDNVLSIAEVGCVQISTDRETGVWDPELILSASKRVQESEKSLLLCGEFSAKEYEPFRALSPRGLAIMRFATTSKSAGGA